MLRNKYFHKTKIPIPMKSYKKIVDNSYIQTKISHHCYKYSLASQITSYNIDTSTFTNKKKDTASKKH